MLRTKKATAVLVVLALSLFVSAGCAQTVSGLRPDASRRAGWVPLGPDGGDVRSLAHDPRNPDHIYLGTSAGQLYLSINKGVSWSRFAHFGGTGYVLDNIEIDPQSGTIYVAAWDGHIERQNGDLFRSVDVGKTWQALPDVHGKSIRAMTLAPSDPKIILLGALDGVFRSRDAGITFERISPPDQAEIRNIQSVSVDPNDPNIIYAGTRHLAWKTADGGSTWHSIKQGVIDDSDVFSIIVDYSKTQNVYLSACSGIYKSENQAELFHKVQGIPFSARRTRVLKQDPMHPSVVYAGTTEGLWKTLDGGSTWRRITAPNIIVNDVHVDLCNPSRVLIATDHSGVLASNDAGQTFAASNRGFAHRYVSSVAVDRNDPQTLYAGVINDKEFGGVFVSRNGGVDWEQLSSGLAGRDVLSLRQAENGVLVAGTSQGVFLLDRYGTQWRPINTVLQERVIPPPTSLARSKTNKPLQPRVGWVKSELKAQVNAVELTPRKWFLASPAGLYQSADNGMSWKGGPIGLQQDFISVIATDHVVLAITHTAAVVSHDGGETWTPLQLPSYVTPVYGGAIAPNQVLWLATREGAFRSGDGGATWEHVLSGLPARQLAAVQYDSESGRLLAIALNGDVFASRNGGQLWQRQEIGFPVRSVASARGRLIAATAFDGVIAQPEPASVERAASAGGGNK
jgi:photosystem II stability/assembly factor-like uncharacterized protein